MTMMTKAMVRSGLGALLLALLTPAALDAQSFSEGGFVPQPAVAEALDDRPSVSELQGLTIFSNRAAFLSAFPHLTLEDFEGLNVANNAVCSGAAPLSSTTNDTCATPGTVAAGFELDTSPRTLYATLGPSTTYLNTSKVAGPNTYANDLVLRFTRPVFVAGFDIACAVGPVSSLSIEIYLAGGLHQGTTINCAGFPNVTFLGVAASVPIDRIETVTADTATGELIDNLVFGSSAADDLVLDLGALGTWGLLNSSADTQALAAAQADLTGFPLLHPFSAEETAIGDVDGNGTEDVILDFPGYGVWALLNNRTWVQLHGLNASAIVAGDVDGQRTV
jgi:hypothetical protein